METQHHVSKEAANEFFELGKKWFPLLYEAKQREGITRKVPQFVHLRRKLHERNVPKISLDVAYVHKTTGEETVLRDVQSIPTKQFPPNEYLKIYEMASVKVIKLNLLKSTQVPFFFRNFSACVFVLDQTTNSYFERGYVKLYTKFPNFGKSGKNNDYNCDPTEHF